MTVDGLEAPAKLPEVEELINPAQQVICRDVLVEVERVKSWS